MTAKGAKDGTSAARRTRDDGRGQVCVGKRKMTINDQEDGQQQGELDVVDGGGANRLGAIAKDVHVQGSRNFVAKKRGNRLRTLSTTSTVLVPG